MSMFRFIYRNTTAWMLLFFFVLLLLSVLANIQFRQHAATDLPKANTSLSNATRKIQLGSDSPDFNFELAKVDNTIASLNALIATNPIVITLHEKLSLAYLDRARLSGSIDDYRKADAAIAQAFSNIDTRTGPLITRAKIHLALHRNAAALTDISLVKGRLLIDQYDALAIDGLTADALLQLGSLDKALELYSTNYARKPSFQNASRLSRAYAARGNMQQAEHWLNVAQEQTVAQSNYQIAWLALQRGILDLTQTHLNNAYQHFEKADQHLPGYWLIEEHLAEVDTLLGRTALAENRYRAIVDRAPLPQMQIALADVLELRDQVGNEAEIRMLRDQATQQLQNISADYPDLVLEH